MQLLGMRMMEIKSFFNHILLVQMDHRFCCRWIMMVIWIFYALFKDDALSGMKTMALQILPGLPLILQLVLNPKSVFAADMDNDGDWIF